MRDSTSWRKSIVGDLREIWSSAADMDRGYFCNIELGLYLLSQVAPADPANTLWVLLTGYPFSTQVSQHWSDSERQMVGNARHILPYFRSEFQWTRALRRYRRIDEQVRGYDVESDLKQFVRKPVSIASKRYEKYDAVLKTGLQYQKDSIKWAEAGTYGFIDRSYRTQVKIPAELVFPPPEGHRLSGQQQRQSFTATWDKLLETAHWMDTQLQVSWYAERLRDVRLEIFDQDDTLRLADRLTLSGMTNLVGMVSSGKSTLMKILTVWAARKGLRITLVVGDVIGALNLAELFHNLGLSVAPVLGQSNRKRHTNRLHRVLATEHPNLSPLEHRHIGFRWLSTTCPLDGLREETQQPIGMKDLPCMKLEAIRDEKQTEFTCPIYAVCPFHQAQRDLATANIWIATPASLVYTRVAKQVNTERIRFLELVYRQSDLVIVNEADQVQVQLDMTFSPGQTLVSQRQEGWLDVLSEQVVRELNQGGRGQLFDEQVDHWQQVNETAQIATNRIYGLLLRNPVLRSWVVEGDYFTDWTLFEKLSRKLIGRHGEEQQAESNVTSLPEMFENYLQDPLGEKGAHPLAEIARQCITVPNSESVRIQIIEWIQGWEEYHAALSDEELTEVAACFEISLLVAVLQNRLHILIRDWKQVEEPLKLEGKSSMLFNRPPKDYETVIPVSPMGNVLAFQYIRHGDTQNDSGDLRFFRCMGVGRWLLLHLHELCASDPIAGPHVLLLSGSSWAGTSPGYHIQTPVAGILRAPEKELEAVRESIFRFTPFSDDQGNPVKVSGKQGKARIAALENILGQLARKSSLGGLSRLEQERNELPETRQRILLLVGSYEEARRTREILEGLRTDWKGYVLNLVPDDDGFESDWRGSENSLQRGLVHGFAETGAWILIAPLLAIERGHNILNEEDRAAIGAAYFLVRPHPRPDDISFAIQSINRWAIEKSADASLLANIHGRDVSTLYGVGKTFREEAYIRWRHFLHLPMRYSTLPEQERESVTWNLLVSVWQVIGRLIRGGSPAKIYFCDAAFAIRSAVYDEHADNRASSLLVGIQQILHPYFQDDSTVSHKDKLLVQALYGPFYHAISNMEGLVNV